MSRTVRSALLLGMAVISLSACAGDKGPGDIGTVDDIVIRNNGLPGAKKEEQKQAEALPADPAAAPATDAAAQGGDFTSTVEQAEAHPAPEVAAAESLSPAAAASTSSAQPETPAAAPAAQTSATATAPVTGTTAPPVTEAEPTAAMPTPAPASAGAPAQPATPAATSVPVAAASTTTETPVAAAATAAPAIPAAAPMPEGVEYPLDLNAPYSPKAVADAVAAAGATQPSAPAETPAAEPASPSAVPAISTGNPSDASTIKAAQAALKAKGGYDGVENGEVDAAFLNALILYQAKNNLPQGGLNEATLKSLGVLQ